MHKQNTFHSQGFTLIEVLITVAIASVLMTIAAPNFSTLVKNNKISASVTEFTGTLYLARSEAIKRGTFVTVCKSQKITEDKYICVNAGDWEQGWITFEDSNNNGLFDDNEALNTSNLIRIHKALPANLTLIGNANVNDHITYASTGRLSTAINGTITLCDDRNGEAVGKGIVIIPTGRFRVTKKLTAQPNTDITC